MRDVEPVRAVSKPVTGAGMWSVELRFERHLTGMLFADVLPMRKVRKQQGSTAVSNTGKEVQETRETVAALADAPVNTAPQSVGDTTAAVPDRERIAMRAYELYLARDGGDGSAFDDWLAAEREFYARKSD